MLVYISLAVNFQGLPVTPPLLCCLQCAALCNDSSLYYDPERASGSGSFASGYHRIGEATEVALRVVVEKVGQLHPQPLSQHCCHPHPPALHIAAARAGMDCFSWICLLFAAYIVVWAKAPFILPLGNFFGWRGCRSG